MQALKPLYRSPAAYPEGKLILAFRKEYHPEIEAQFKNHELPRVPVYLQPLDRDDIIEVVTGLTSTQQLKDKYCLEVEDPLPVIIADDLLDDKGSPVAPTLQIILTKMWHTSKTDKFSPLRASSCRLSSVFLFVSFRVSSRFIFTAVDHGAAPTPGYE